MKKFIRIISPITLAVVLALDGGIIAFGIYAVEKIMQKADLWNILFVVIEVFAFLIGALVTKEVLSNGVKFNDNEVEFTGLDDNNIFPYSTITKVETQKDTKASLKKNFVDRYSHIILYLNDESVVTIDLGLTTTKALNKIKNEIINRL